MNLSDYADMINLKQPYQAASQNHTAPQSDSDDLSAAIEAILADPESRNFIAQNPVPTDKDMQRRWLQAALTVRPPGALPKDMIETTNRLLQKELKQKNIIKASTLPRLSGAYPVAEKVSIWDGDISLLEIGAITNAANSQMLGCFQPFHACIDNAINCSAGPQLREDCNTIMQAQGKLEQTGKAKITRAYNLPSEFVLHTVGPIVTGGLAPSKEQEKQLASCYESCLSLAAEVGVHSVALCGISTGVFGFPPEPAANIALKTVARWFAENPSDLDHVVFNTYGAAATQIYQSAITNWSNDV